MDDTGLGTLLGMGLATLLVMLAISGLIIGALARLVLPGPDPMGWLSTIGFGIAGSLVGGFVARLLGVPVGFNLLTGVAGAAFLIWFFRRRG